MIVRKAVRLDYMRYAKICNKVAFGQRKTSKDLPEEFKITRKVFNSMIKYMNVYVFIKKGHIIGYSNILIDEKENTGEILEFVIDPKYQDEGNGMEAYKMLEKIMKKKQIQSLNLFCATKTTYAFWKEAGFELKYVDHFWKDI